MIKKAFTIVELLIVMVIIGIIASVTLISYSGISSNATNATIQSDLANADSQLKLYNAEFGYYPSSLTSTSGKVCPTGNTNYCLI